ncbi:MAG TPA: response regulator transcription factor, partial [Solirubrobacterales bacterium]|nr:response regulator transcription factor [Solirubrobacterales bacterium]
MARILLVDDEQAVQKLLSYPLQKEGYEVVRAHDGREALEQDDEGDKVLGLEMGADDYITKPFSIRELRSRIRAAMRRASLAPQPEAVEVIESDALRIDLPRRAVEIRGEEAQLTYLEFELLRTLASTPGRVYTRQALLDKLWGGAAYRDPRTIDVHVRHLREKIEQDPSDPEYIFTVRGVGYRFRDA